MCNRTVSHSVHSLYSLLFTSLSPTHFLPPSLSFFFFLSLSSSSLSPSLPSSPSSSFLTDPDQTAKRSRLPFSPLRLCFFQLSWYRYLLTSLPSLPRCYVSDDHPWPYDHHLPPSHHRILFYSTHTQTHTLFSWLLVCLAKTALIG